MSSPSHSVPQPFLEDAFKAISQMPSHEAERYNTTERVFELAKQIQNMYVRLQTPVAAASHVAQPISSAVNVLSI